MSLNFGLNGFHCDKDRREHEVDHYTTPEIYHRHVELVRSLRSIAHCQDETCEECGKIKPLEDHSEDSTRRTEKVRVSERGCQYPEDKEKVTLVQYALASSLKQGNWKLTIANQAKSMLIIWYVNSTKNISFLVKL